MAALLVAAVALGLIQLRERVAARAAFPISDGRLRVEGLEQPVEILRDRLGVPHVDARSAADAFFGLGFVHAQDRLAQMLWLVRSARGRTAQLIGADGLAADRLARILDLGGRADADFEGLDANTRRLLEAYARGVNARIARLHGSEVAAPLMAVQLGLPLEPWRPADSLAVLELYAWGLSSTLDASLVLDELLEKLGGFGARRFFPEGAGESLLPAPGRVPVTAGVWRDPLRRALGLEGRSIGSSAWVVGGAHAENGLPLLAADAHLEPTAPPLLHVDHIRGGDYDVAGATLPGVPIVWTGHNPRVAWASTHARAAVMDLYTEQLNSAGEPLYHDGRAWRALEQRVETIVVRGADDEVLTVRSTHHGPLVHELFEPAPDPVALTWVGTRASAGRSIAAMLGVARAGNVVGLINALEGYHLPALALVYADAEGSAGMQVAGWIPNRPLATGLVPVPGRARWYDWQGRIPFKGLPHWRMRRGQGWAIAADNGFAPTATADAGTWLWRNGARAQRIDGQLRSAVGDGSLSLRRVAALQVDVGDRRARRLVAAALRVTKGGEPLGAEALEVADLLRGWDGQATPRSVGASVYHVWLVSLTEQLLGRQLEPGLLRRYLALPQVDPEQVVLGIVQDAESGGEGGGWSDPAIVSKAIRDSLRESWFRLSFRLGPNRRKWSWGSLHALTFRRFGPVTLERAGALGPFGVGGSGSTVNVAEYDPGDPYAVRVASTYRFAIDLATPDRARCSWAPGQSEHPRHPHFSDGLTGWLAGRSGLLPTSRSLVEEATVSRLHLEPSRAGVAP